MPANDLALLTEAALDAGEIARRHFGRGPKSWEKAGGQGPVSAADIEIDRMLRARLTAARPGHGWLSEETEDEPARLAAREVFIVDPIDGTRAFLDGQKSFAHSLAIAREGRVVAGVVHLPLMGLTYTATLDGGARLNGQRLILPPREGLGGARVLAARSQLQPELWPGGVPPVQRHFRPSLAWRMCLVAEGEFDAMLTLANAWHWDIAAGSLIAAEAGAQVTDRAGRPILFNTPHPRAGGVLAAPAPMHAAFLERLAERRPETERA